MSHLIKYEFRKSLLSKLVIAGIAAVLEAAFLIGIFCDLGTPAGIGAGGLFFIALAGIGFIGIESILTLYRDLTTKQSYMLFMTPNNSYRILGAKVLENAVSVLLTGAFFGLLAALDFSLLLTKFGAYSDLIEFAKRALESIDPRLTLDYRSFFTLVFMLLCSWLLRIGTGYLAVVIGCTLLAGKKGCWIICFLFYIGISILIGLGMDRIPDTLPIFNYLMIQSVISLVCALVMYFITAWIMDRKLSV